ncbi:DUF2972 domain-containing protein, partial [Campylobacter helveticus]
IKLKELSNTQHTNALSDTIKAYAKAGLDYRLIPAEKAWEMNLPLPRRYEFVGFFYGVSAHQPLEIFFTKSFGLNFICLTDGSAYANIHQFYSMQQKDVAFFAYWFMNQTNQSRKRIYLSANFPFLILVRDPISRLKSQINHGYFKDACLCERTTFHLNDNIDEVLDRRRFYTYCLYPSIEESSYLIECAKNVNFSYTSTAELCQKEVYYIDASEVNPDRVMESMRKYAKFFNKNMDEERLLSLESDLKTIRWNILKHIIPLSLEINNLKIEITVKNQKGNLKDCTKKFIDKNYSELFNIVILAMKEKDFKSLKENEKLFNETKIYLNQFIEKLENLRQNYVKTFVKENDVLNYLKTHKQEALTFKEILDKELTHIKTHRPDIVASWKYYGEFERMCGEMEIID